MIDQKFILKSKTVWGVIIMAAPQLAPLAGIAFGMQDAAELNETVTGIATGVGALLALYGRVKAQQTISFK